MEDNRSTSARARALYPFLMILAIIMSAAPLLPPSLRTAFFLLFLTLGSSRSGALLFPRLPQAFRLALGFILLVSYVSVVCAVVFYAFALTRAALIAVAASIPVLLYAAESLLSRFSMSRAWEPDEPAAAPGSRVTGSAVILSGAVLLYLVIRSQTTASALTPWQLMPSSVYLVAGMMVYALAFHLLKKRAAAPVVSAVAYAGLFGLIPLLFPLGFGYDPFIHQATEEILIQQGTIEPKPLYYVGYYALIALSHAMTGLQTAILDRFLLPVILIGLLPTVLVYAERAAALRRIWPLSPVLLLLLPYDQFIQSTPQSLSFVWTFLVIVLSALALFRQVIRIWLLALVAFAAVSFHPLTGLPALLFVAALAALKARSGRLRAALCVLAGVLGAVGLPAALLLAGRFIPQLQTAVSAQWSGAAVLDTLIGYWHRIVSLDDLVYVLVTKYYIVLWIAALAGAIYAMSVLRDRRWLIYPVAAGILFGTYVLVSGMLSFNFLTADEQRTFALRILKLSALFLFPAYALGIRTALERAGRASRLHATMACASLALLAMAVWYVSYPRFDRYVHFKGYSASAADYEAVRWVNARGGSDAYVVLANQTVSAVAVREFGFARYLNGMLYYPLPTSGPLYAYYLDLAHDRRNIAQTVADAARATGAARVFFILNAYWENAEALIERHREAADRSAEFGNGAVWVFMYAPQPE